MMTDEKVEECVHMLREKNAEATIISTPWEELGKDAVLHALQHGAEIEGILEEHAHEHDDHEHHYHHDDECGCGHDHEHHHDHEEHEHHHEHDENCTCGCHDHDHEHHHDENCTCGCHDHHHGHEGHHHADEVFTSWGKETAHKYTEEELDYLLKALSETDAYGTVLRSKGIIQMADGSWKQFDMVPEEYEVREGQADYTGRVCVIGTDLKEEDLIKLFHI